MKKDINIPEVKDVHMAIVSQYNEEFQCDDWYAYVVNKGNLPLDIVLIVSKGFNESIGKETSLMRHKIDVLPAKSGAKVELIQQELLDKMDNLFNLTYFCEGKMFDKQFEFKKGTVTKETIQEIKEIGEKGILL
ncbi:MAG: hypothetical protein ACPGR7_10285 [Flavobacteriaceae bacterium]